MRIDDSLEVDIAITFHIGLLHKIKKIVEIYYYMIHPREASFQ